MQQQRPKPFVSKLGTRINNTGNLDPNQMRRVQQLANSGYGTKAQQVANTLNKRANVAAPAPTNNSPSSPQDIQNVLDKIKSGEIHGDGTTGVPQGQQTPATGTTDNGGSGQGIVAGEGNPSGVDNGVENGAGNVLFPSQQAFEPTDYNGSPLYKWQQQEGQTSLNRLLAKRGLLNSGAEIEANNRFQTALGAGEADKARGYAQNEADRYERMSQNEALRRERQGNQASDNAYRWTQLYLNQNPMDYAMKGTDSYANTLGKDASTMANYLSQLYTKAHGSSGGGPGPFIPPFPSGPDFSNIDTIGALTKGSGNNNWANGILNSLPGFFDPKNWA